MKVFLDVDGVLIDGWHANPERRNPWDATIGQDLGINRQAFQAKFFGSFAGVDETLMHACVRGERDLKDALADVLPNVGYNGSVDAFVAYWFEKDSNVNLDVLDAVNGKAPKAGGDATGARKLPPCRDGAVLPAILQDNST